MRDGSEARPPPTGSGRGEEARLLPFPVSPAPPRACYTFPLEVGGSFEDTALSATRWSQKDKDGMTHFCEVPRDRKEDGGFQGLREEGEESLTHGDTVSVCGDGKDLWVVVIVHNHVKALRATELSTEKRLRTFLAVRW